MFCRVQKWKKTKSWEIFHDMKTRKICEWGRESSAQHHLYAIIFASSHAHHHSSSHAHHHASSSVHHHRICIMQWKHYQHVFCGECALFVGGRNVVDCGDIAMWSQLLLLPRLLCVGHMRLATKHLWWLRRIWNHFLCPMVTCASTCKDLGKSVVDVIVTHYYVL